MLWLRLDGLDELVNKPDRLGRFLGMDPVARIERLETHVWEELAGNGDIVFVEISRVLALEEERRAVPCRVTAAGGGRGGGGGGRGRGIGKIANLGYSAMKQIQRYTECKVSVG